MQQHGSKYFACRPPPLDPGDGVNRSKFNFFRIWPCCITNSRELGIEHHVSTYSLLTHTPSTCGLDKTLKNQNVKCGHVAYQIKGKEV